jgi:hypothetical protein
MPPRFLIGVVTIAYLAIGVTLIVQPARYDNTPSYGLLLELLSQTAWGVIYLVVASSLGAGIVCARWRRGRLVAVVSHTAAIALTSVWTAAFIVRWFTDSGTTIVNVVSWSVYLALLARSVSQLDGLRPREEPAL